MDEGIEGIMNELVDEDIELAVDSFSTRGPGPCRFDVLPNSVGTLVTNLTGREQLLKWQWILEHL